MGNLYHDTGTITGIFLAATCAAVFHVFKNSQCIADVLMTFDTLDTRYKPNATCITFKRWMI